MCAEAGPAFMFLNTFHFEFLSWKRPLNKSVCFHRRITMSRLTTCDARPYLPFICVVKGRQTLPPPVHLADVKAI